MKQQIVSRYDSNTVLFQCEVPDDIDSGMAMRHALERAVATRANLTDANLARANLTGAYLAGANLTRANLTDAYLADANLARANLTDANLARANLTRANLTGAYLARADLTDANLTGANLTDAYLAGANLTGAYLTGANLAGAYLTGAKIRDGIVLSRRPLQIAGLTWTVTIYDAHMQIGCQFHSLHDWQSFDDETIVGMDGRNALRFWRAHKETLLSLARADGRSFEPYTLADETQAGACE